MGIRRERHSDQLPPIRTPSRDPTHNLSIHTDWDRICNVLMHRMALQLSHPARAHSYICMLPFNKNTPSYFTTIWFILLCSKCIPLESIYGSEKQTLFHKQKMEKNLQKAHLVKNCCPKDRVGKSSFTVTYMENNTKINR